MGLLTHKAILYSSFCLLCLSYQTVRAELAVVPASAANKIPAQIKIMQNLAPLPWLVVELPAARSKQLIQDYPIYSDVRGRFASDVTPPNDPLYEEQWHITSTDVPVLWQMTQGAGVTVAVLDSGIDHDHPDLVGNVLFEQGYDFGDDDDAAHDSIGHGTAMAGLIAAHCNNGMGGCGIAPAAKVIPYKLNKDAEGGFSSIALAAAILAATASEAQIISMSLVLDDHAPWVEHALRYAATQNKILIAAVGNQGNPQVAFPASLPWVVGVGALDQSQQRLSSSNYGNGLFISAPGVNLWTTLVGESYADWFSGSSAATALVSGMTALFVAQSPQMTDREVVIKLLSHSRDLGLLGFDKEYGFGAMHAMPSTKSTEATNIYLNPLTQTLYYPSDVLQLDLTLEGVKDRQGDLFLRLNLPIDDQGSRQDLYKIWQSPDSLQVTAYNRTLTSPYPFTNDLFLSLYGTPHALLGDGQIQAPSQTGVFELLVELHLFEQNAVPHIMSTRQLLWVSNN